MNRQGSARLYLTACIALVSAGLFGQEEESRALPYSATQRESCIAGCRQQWQASPDALEACLRDCGAPEPAIPTRVGTPVDRADLVQPATTPCAQETASNLNLSKSNVDRKGGKPAEKPVAAEATTVKSSKSNSSERAVAPETGEPCKESSPRGER